jgi:hypothetical protein
VGSVGSDVLQVLVANKPFVPKSNVIVAAGDQGGASLEF